MKYKLFVKDHAFDQVEGVLCLYLDLANSQGNAYSIQGSLKGLAIDFAFPEGPIRRDLPGDYSLNSLQVFNKRHLELPF